MLYAYGRTLHLVLLVLAITVGALVSACGATRDTALVHSDADLLKATAQGDLQEAVAAGDAAWGQRADRAKLEAAIEAWEHATTLETPALSQQQRRDALYDVYLKLSHAYYFLADGYVRFETGDEDAREERMMNVYNKGVTASEKGLAIYSPSFAKAIRYDTPIDEAIKTLDKGASKALYWYASNLGKWALLEGFATILSRKDTIKVAMDKVEADVPVYANGGSYRYLGAYYTKLPFPGGDLPKSKSYFDKAINAAPNYLATRVLLAKDWATKAEDKDEFKKQLEFVLAFDLSKAPEIEAENIAEQHKAKDLLAQIDDLF